MVNFEILTLLPLKKNLKKVLLNDNQLMFYRQNEKN